MPNKKKGDRVSVSLAEVCRRVSARVNPKDVQRAFRAIVDAAMDGEEVRIPELGFFRATLWKGNQKRVRQFPITPESPLITITIPATWRIQFRQATSLSKELRRRAKGRSVASWS